MEHPRRARRLVLSLFILSLFSLIARVHRYWLPFSATRLSKLFRLEKGLRNCSSFRKKMRFARRLSYSRYSLPREAHKGLCGNSQFIKWLLTLTRYLLLRVRHHGKHCAEQHSHVFSYKERTMLLELAKTVRSVYRTRVQKIFPYKTVAI